MCPQGTDSGVRSADEVTEGSELRPWHLTTLGLAVVALDALLAVVLVVGTTELASSVLVPLGSDWTSAVTVDPFVYLFGVLGALGYVFTALVREFDRSAEDLVRYNVRLLAALPLAAGVFLLSELLLANDPSDEVLAGAAFVTGLYVNLVYERLGALADRLFPSRAQ